MMDKSNTTTQTLTEGSSDFIAPRHWVELEELDQKYWDDSKKQEARGQEFLHKPIETLEMIERLDSKGLARREFLTVMGASMALASAACARKPVTKIIPYVVKPEGVTPGVPTWYASTCQECSTGCGILTKNREGRPIKIEGNPDHPVNEGALCARGQASVLNLYDPDRIRGPYRMSSGSSQPVDWKSLDAEISQKLKAVRGGKVRVLSHEVTGDSTRRLVREFLSAFESGVHVEFDPLSSDEISSAQELSYGSALTPHYRFDQADLVVSFGADFLGQWISPVEHARDWSKKRKLDSQNAARAQMSKLLCFESGMSITGANADERYPIRPGDELKIVMALANEIVDQTRYSSDSQIKSVLRTYSAQNVAEDVGGKLTAGEIKKIAQELLRHRGRSLVIAGGLTTQTQDALALQVAVNFLNSALDNEGKTLEGTQNYRPSRGGFAELKKLVAELESGSVDVLILYRSNPAYFMPGVEKSIRKAKLVIAVTDRVDESARSADYVLADHHYLENWGDAQPHMGVVSLQQPAVNPLGDTRSLQETLMAWIKEMGGTGLASREKNWHDYLRSNWKETFHGRFGAGKTFEEFWVNTLQKGVLMTGGNAGSSARSFRTASINSIPKYSKSEPGIKLAVYSNVSMGDGQSANNAWLQELPDPISTITWDNYLNVGPGLAKNLSLQNGDVVEVSGGEQKLRLPVWVQPGLNANTVTAAVGYGRTGAGRIGDGVGQNLFAFGQMSSKGWVLSGQTVSIKKTGARYNLAATQGHHKTEGRPLINDITLDEFKENPATENHTNPHMRMKEVPTLWTKHEYKGYKWAMGIDLNSCTGCGACVTACQAENNIPVVGRDRVRVSREMHWIRIDRYYAGSAENPDVVFQPMLCQHCDNAPCETVCPVLATTHNSEGLNDMTYNRCVGTRYCQNNCPYKVRRFNFFDHWKEYRDPMSRVFNPDVTVRTRGVMEKCTFCVQRINDVRARSKDQGRTIRDGELKTACQQTCPTEAIVFGNINDAESRVAKIHKDPRAFRVLEVLNARPAISYLSKVRNKEEGAAHVEHH